MTYRLQRVVIEGFRAYASRAEFDCSGEVVALVGANGWGKTSFFDAITWCLFGRIPRLAGTRDFVGVEFIRNRFTPEIQPYVSIGLEAGTESVVLARDSNGLRVVTDAGELEADEAEEWIATLIRGERLPNDESSRDVENDGGDGPPDLQDDPESVFLRCHHLAQDQMTAFLRESSPRDRFDTLASLLGLDVIRSFYRHISVVRRDLNDELDNVRRQQRQLEQRLGSLRSEAEEIEATDDGSSPTMEVLVAEFGRLLDDAAAVTHMGLMERKDVESAADLGERTRDLSLLLADFASQQKFRSSELARLMAEMRQVAQESEVTGQLTTSRQMTATEISSLRKSAAELERRLQDEVERRAALGRELGEVDQRREDLVAFLTLADAYLTSDTCPLCRQLIELDAVKESVAQRMRSLPDELVALQSERRAADARTQQLELAIDDVRQRLRIADERIAAIDQRLSARSAAIDRFRASVDSLQIDRGDKGLEEILAVEADAASELVNAVTALVPRADLLARRAAFLAGRDRLSKLRAQHDALQETLTNTVADVRELASAEDLAGTVIMAARRSERDLVRSMFQSIEPTLDLLYGRLRPHPVLDRLRLDIGSFDERGEIRFVAYSAATEANVNTIFSSAQLNAVAVCVFLAMNLAVSRSKVSFALLDDPIQNMDDFNVLGLLDLLRGLVGDRQLVVSTHDEQIGELVRRKLRPQGPGGRTILHRFLSYRDIGPVVETEIDDYAATPSVMEQAIAQ